MNKDLSRVDDVDLYIVGACICHACGGTVEVGILAGCAAFCWFCKGFLKGVKNEK